jgi:hypothetical protein
MITECVYKKAESRVCEYKLVRNYRVQAVGSYRKYSIYAHLATRQICKHCSNSSEVLRSRSIVTDDMASRIHSFRSESFWPLYKEYTPHKRKPKPRMAGSASQTHHFDKFSADNNTYLARPEQHEYSYKGSSSLNKSCKSPIATLRTRKRLYVFFWVIPRRLNSDVGELPRRKYTTFRTRRKFEINNTEEVPTEKSLFPIHLTVIENLFTTGIVLMALQLCFPVTRSKD